MSQKLRPAKNIVKANQRKQQILRVVGHLGICNMTELNAHVINKFRNPSSWRPYLDYCTMQGLLKQRYEPLSGNMLALTASGYAELKAQPTFFPEGGVWF